MRPLARSFSTLATLARAALVAASVGGGLGAAAALPGCENAQPKTALGYTEDAKRAYDTAMDEFNSHNWIEAQTLLREVKRKYSYSKWARQAELRIADADMQQDKFSDAIREYKDFIHAHRADEEDVAYARSKIAEATYAEIPESFLLPAAEERDHAAVVDAYTELRDYLGDYPGSKQAGHMRELLAAVTARLVRHELYVARFYLRKDDYDAAVARIQYALRNYGASIGGAGGLRTEASGLEAEALLLLGTTYLQMKKWPDARQAFEAIVKGYVQSPLADQAKNYLEFMRQRGV
jgi:outer membrane protein assembly factor BamD